MVCEEEKDKDKLVNNIANELRKRYMPTKQAKSPVARAS